MYFIVPFIVIFWLIWLLVGGLSGESKHINTTAKKWRELNPNLAKDSNLRDYATINELTVLSNLESHNAESIKEGKSKEERFDILISIAKYQLNVLDNAEKIKLLGDSKGNEE